MLLDMLITKPTAREKRGKKRESENQTLKKLQRKHQILCVCVRVCAVFICACVCVIVCARVCVTVSERVCA